LINLDVLPLAQAVTLFCFIENSYDTAKDVMNSGNKKQVATEGKTKNVMSSGKNSKPSGANHNETAFDNREVSSQK
jgi:hypothetical protein